MLCLDFIFNMYLSKETLVKRKRNANSKLNVEINAFVIQVVSAGFAIILKIPYTAATHVCY